MKDQLYRKIYPATNIRYYLQELSKEDISDDAIFSGTGLDRLTIDKRDSRVSIHQEQLIIKNILSISRNPHIALDSGKQTRLSSFGLLGFTMMCCKNLSEAVEMVIKLWGITGPMLNYSLLTDGKHSILRYENHLCLDEDLLRFRTELGFSTKKSLGEQVVQNTLPFTMVHLSYPAPPHYRYYSDIFQCPVLFDQKHNQIMVDLEIYDLPLPQANPYTLNECRQSCEDIIETLDLEDSLVKQVHQILMRSVGNFPDVQSVADQLHITPRGLHRKLKDLDTSFQKILNSIRKHIAIKCLRTTDLTVDKIANLTGYSESSNFRAAFKKWTGKSPNQFRKYNYMN